jgi:hypothetical protein
MKIKLTLVLLVVSLLLLFVVPVSAMDMHVEGNRLIISGPLSGFELTQFASTLTPNVATVVLHDSSGGDFDAGLNLAVWIRQKGLTTVAQGYCRSSCANAFLGGTRRYVADDQSYVAFHGHYAGSNTNPSNGRIGELRNFYAEMTGGKVSDDLVQVWLRKHRAGMVYFFRDRTYNCNGTEPERPSGCEKIPPTALEQGIITSLDDVTVETVGAKKHVI